MKKHCLLFELDSIQSYLFSSGRMRDLIGASELLEWLTSRNENEDSLLDAVCEAAGVSGDVQFSRRAGGAFYAFSGDEQVLRRLCALWTLAVQQAAPYLGYSLGLGSGADEAAAFDQARQALRCDASRHRPVLPLAAPVVERSRRTGRAGVAVGRHAKDGVIDAAVAVHRRFADMSESRFLARFAPQASALGWRDWPRQLQPEPDNKEGGFPFKGEDRTLALIHADGNGLGKILQVLNRVASEETEGGVKRDFVTLYQNFSELIEKVTVAAARHATEKVLIPAREKGQCLPARPILLAGDDITVLVRADLAMDYVRVFARHFEEASREALARFARDHGLAAVEMPDRLTLGVGMVYLRASQPFQAGFALVETLIKEAKQRAKALKPDDPDASIAFHRVTATLIDDYDSLVQQTLTHRAGGEVFVDSLGTYFLGDAPAPRVDDLRDLVALLGQDDMARGPTRQLLTLMGQGLDGARRRYVRWRELMKKHRPRHLRVFDDCLARLMPGAALREDLPYAQDAEGTWRSALGDALALLGAAYRENDKSHKEDQEDDAA